MLVKDLRIEKHQAIERRLFSSAGSDKQDTNHHESNSDEYRRACLKDQADQGGQNE